MILRDFVIVTRSEPHVFVIRRRAREMRSGGVRLERRKVERKLREVLTHNHLNPSE